VTVFSEGERTRCVDVGWQVQRCLLLCSGKRAVAAGGPSRYCTFLVVLVRERKHEASE
jgi:hypothetical protein